MKIVFDHQIFMAQRYGGVSRYYTTLASHLLNQGQDVKVLAGFYLNQYLANLPNSAVKGSKLKEFPLRSRKLFKLLNHVAGQIQIKKWNPDLIHETYYSTLPSTKSSAVRVTTVYDMVHELFESSFSKTDKTKQNKLETCERVDHILCISQSTKNDLLQLLNINESKVSVVHLGVNLDTFQRPNVVNLFGSQPYILYVGTRGGYKNFSRFLKACAASSLIKNQIKIIAFGGGDFCASELDQIKKLGFNDDYVVQLSGSDELLSSLYANAMCFVYPSLYEGFGLPPLESMAAGCPVVSSNSSSMPEIVGNAGIFFNPNSVDDIREAIETTLTDSLLRNQLITLGYKNIKRFSWEKCAANTYEVYKLATGKK